MVFPSPVIPSRDVERLRSAFRQTMHDHWLFFLCEGVVLFAVGCLAVVVPTIASLATTLFLGWLFLVVGVAGLASTLFTARIPGFWWSLLSAAAAIVAGGLLIWWPIGGILSLTLILSAFFVVDGVASILFSLEHRRHFSRSWGWILASGILDLVLAGIIVSGFPGTAAWAIGLIVGIDLAFGGLALVMNALLARTES